MAEKSLPASAKKRRRARERGDCAHSAVLAPALLLLAAPLVGGIFAEIFQTLKAFLLISLEAGADFHTKDLLVSAQQFCVVLGLWSLALLCGAALLSTGVECWQRGLRVSSARIWQPTRLNPFHGLQQVLSWGNYQGWPLASVRFAVLIVAWFSVALLRYPELTLELIWCESEELTDLVQYSATELQRLCLRLGTVFAVLAVLDYLHAQALLLRRLRMDRSELQRELRESEGDPSLAAQRRQLHAELSTHRMLQDVRSAKVVVVD